MWGPFFGFMSFVIANLSLNYMRPWAMGLLLCLVFKQFYDFNTLKRRHMFNDVQNHIKDSCDIHT